jgi:C4-dicarboxylate transporter DctM subunit
MSTDAVAVLGFVSLFALMLLRVPVGMAMGLVGVSGFSYLVGATPALKLVGQTSMRTVTDYTFGVIPMFLLMGSFVSNSGMSRELFRAANGFVGHLPRSAARRSQPRRRSRRSPIPRCAASAIRNPLPPA